MKLSSTLKLAVSESVRMNSLALQKKAQGIRVYNLSAGEPMLPPHPKIMEAATQAIAQGKTHYPPVAGIPELREAMTQWLNATYQTTYKSAQCIVTCGGKFGIYASLQAVLEPGDEVLVLAPYWVSYTAITQMFSARSVVVPTTAEHGWKTSVEDIARATTLRTRILILNNAANPTGVLYTREELRAFLAFAASREITVLSDEVYSGLVYDGKEFVSCGSFEEFKDNVILIQSCSKHFAMTGWRVGFVCAPEVLIARLTTIQGQSTTGTSSISQWAALGALENATVVATEVRSAMQKRRDAFTKAFNDVFGAARVPVASGLYDFVPLRAVGVSDHDSVKFCADLLEQGNIATVPGIAFGQEGYVRFSFGAESQELEQALRAFATFLSRA